MQEIVLPLDKLSSKLTQIAQDSYPKSGALKSSIKVTIQDKDIKISFNEYGLYQDGGVKGAFGNAGNNSGQGYNKSIFKYKPTKDKFGRPAPIGKFPYTGPLSYGARVNIRKFGIPAKPWIAKMLNSLTEEIVKDIELTLPPIIEKEIATLLAQIK